MAIRTIEGIRYQHLYNTESHWKSSNPILLEGEIAYSSDKLGWYKIGDGTTHWADINYNTASSADRANSIKSRGVVTAETGTADIAVSGLSMSQAYNNGYPTSYGNILNMRGSGHTELLLGWSGVSGGYAPAYIRSQRDTSDATWSEWAKIYTSLDKPTLSELGAAPASGSTSISKLANTITLGDGSSAVIDQNGSNYRQQICIDDNSTSGDSVFRFRQSANSGSSYTDLLTINDDGNIVAKSFTGILKGNADTSSSSGKWTTPRTLNVIGAVTGSVIMDGSGNMSLNTSVNHSHSYLPLSGGTLTGSVLFSNHNTGLSWSRVTDGASILFNCETDATDNYLTFHVTDDENVNFKWTKNVGGTLLTLGTWKREGLRMVTGSFIGNLIGNSSTADKIKTARTINGTAFDGTTNITTSYWGTARTLSYTGAATSSASVNGSQNISFSLIRRGASVGQSTTLVADKTWYKFASVSIDGAYLDREIAFKVSTGFNRVTDSGILRAHIRTDGNSYFNEAHFYWEYANAGIDTSKFVMVYNTNTKPTVCELWCKSDTSYVGYHFASLSETSRTARSESDWTLYNTWTAGSAATYTTGDNYAHIESTLLSIKNSISGSAASATRATQDASGNVITSSYASSLTVSGQSVTLKSKSGATLSTIATQDTKNTAGSTNTSSKIFLVGAPAQSANPITYSHDTAYVGTDGCLYSNNTKVSVDGHTHNYLPLSGGTLTGTLSNAKSGTYVQQAGSPVIKYTGAAGSHQALYSWQSTNGWFTMGGYEDKFYINYLTSANVSSGTNVVTKQVKLLDEAGNTLLPGVLTVNSNISTNGKLYVGNSVAANAIVYLNNKETIKGIDAWLRINESKAFSSGVYFGSSLVRTDGTLQVGSGGSYLSANSTALISSVPTTLSSTLNVSGITTFDEVTIPKKGAYVHEFAGTDGTAGYVRFLTITIKSTYANVPITFELVDRSARQATVISLAFANENSVTPSLQYFYHSGYTCGVYVLQDTTNKSQWHLYAKKSESYDWLCVTKFHASKYMLGKIGVTWENIHANSLPAGYVTSTLYNLSNTTGSTNTSSKIFLVGATSQTSTPVTYSHDTVYAGTDGHLYSNSKQVINLSDTQALTNKTYNGYTLAAACAKTVTDSSAASAIGTGTALPTERDIYYGLPTINNSHAYTSSTQIYAPSSGGVNGQVCVSNGSLPIWTNQSAITAGKATELKNYYSSRPTSANVTTTGSGGLITFKATSTMTTAKPASDAHILHFLWDSTGGYDSQIATFTGTGRLQVRGQSAGTWSPWLTVLDSGNYSSYALPKSGGTVTGTTVFSKTTDASGTANNQPALIVGGIATAAHMEIDANEIMAKSNGTSTAPIYINNDGGDVNIGGASSNTILKGNNLQMNNGNFKLVYDTANKCLNFVFA